MSLPVAKKEFTVAHNVGFAVGIHLTARKTWLDAPLLIDKPAIVDYKNNSGLLTREIIGSEEETMVTGILRSDSPQVLPSDSGFDRSCSSVLR